MTGESYEFRALEEPTETSQVAKIGRFDDAPDSTLDTKELSDTQRTMLEEVLSTLARCETSAAPKQIPSM
jgi:hypothetical protein